MQQTELQHYGVIGMKWGVRRAERKAYINERLTKKAIKYDLKSDRANRKSERIHAKQDLGRSNRAAIKAANYRIKADKLRKKAFKEQSDIKKTMIEKKAYKIDYKGAKQQIKANKLSKTTGYGVKAMKYSIKSDVLARKAAKARMKIASNKAFIARMNEKASEIPKSTKSTGHDYINNLFNQIGIHKGDNA